MASWPFTDERLRAMYAGGRGDAVARRFSRFWAAVFAAGLCPQRWVTLEVAGRRSGRTGRFPLGMADWQGSWYLVPMLGQDCNWVRNVRAAGGRATLRHRKATACRLVELPPGERAPVLKRYLEQVPGARPHIPVDRHAPLAQFEEIAASYPVFRVEGVEAAEGRPRRVHRWRRRILAIVAILVVLVVAAVVLAVKLQPIPAALRLPTAAPATPIGSVEGTWRVGSGSVAGYRVRETFFGLGNFAVGRTTDVEGTLRVAGDVVTSAVFRNRSGHHHRGRPSAVAACDEPRDDDVSRRDLPADRADEAEHRLRLRSDHDSRRHG